MMDHISKILLSSSKIIIDSLDSASSDKKNPLPFKMDEFIQATVLKVFSDRRVTLSVEGKSFSVKTGIPLKEGEEVFLKAVQAGDNIILKLVDKEDRQSEFGQRFLKNLDRSGPFKYIEKLLENITIPNREMVNKRNTPVENLTRTLPLVLNHLEKLIGPNPSLKAEYQNILQKVVISKHIPEEIKIGALILRNRDTLLSGEKVSDNMKFFYTKMIDVIVKESAPPPVTSNLVYEKTLRNAVSSRISEQGLRDSFDRLSNFLLKMTSGMSEGDKGLLNYLSGNSFIKQSLKLIALLANNENILADDSFSDLDIQDILLNLFKESGEDVSALEKKIKDGFFMKAQKGVFQESETSNGRPEIRKMENLVKDISLKSEGVNKDILKNIIRSSGLKWEKTLKDVITGGQVYNKKVSGELVLNDLKALALSLSASSDEGDEEIISLVRNFIDSLEQMQIINRYSSEESGRYLLPLPAMFDETFKFGQILIDLGGGKKDANDPKNRIIRIAFILELTKLGDLKADFSILKQSITGTFGVGTSELCAYIKSGIPGLTSTLNEHGFMVHGIDCKVIDPEILSNMSLSDQLIEDQKEGLLNLVI